MAAARAAASCSACTCAARRPRRRRPPTALERHRQLSTDLGGEYHEVVGADVADALVASFAHARERTQLVLGASRRSRWAELIRGSVINRVIRAPAPIDVHVISHGHDDGERAATTCAATSAPAARSPPRRRLLGLADRGVGLPLLTLVLAQLRDDLALADACCCCSCCSSSSSSAVGGVWPALVAAVVGVPARQLVLHAAVPHVHDRARARTCSR